VEYWQQWILPQLLSVNKFGTFRAFLGRSNQTLQSYLFTREKLDEASAQLHIDIQEFACQQSQSVQGQVLLSMCCFVVNGA
jgi:hypothetical protein